MAKKRKDSLYRKAEDGDGGHSREKSCPNCSAELGRPIYYPLEFFGERFMRGYGLRIQSWCSACRKRQPPGKRQLAVEQHEQTFIERARQAVWIARQLDARETLIGSVDSDRHDGRVFDEIPLVVDGDCITEAVNSLICGERGEPVEAAFVQSFRTQAEALMRTVVKCYEDLVAKSEVGPTGSARAGCEGPSAGASPIGAVHGRVQSGKTLTSMLTAALAIDNGFRVVVVLMSENHRTVRQTVRRFRSLAGPLVFCPPDDVGGSHSWRGSEKNIERRKGSHGVVFLCSNDEVSLRKLVAFLKEIEAEKLPALILEDGADFDAPIETVPPLLSGRDEAYLLGTSHLIFENGIPGEQGFSIRESLPHNVLVRIAADPSALVKARGERFPHSFVMSLEPGPGYVGGEAILMQGERYVIHVPDEEPGRLFEERTAPMGLACAITFFLLAGLARNRYGETPRPTRTNVFLCHADGKRAELNHLMDLIGRYVEGLTDALETSIEQAAARPEVEWAYRELAQTVSDLPPLGKMLGDLVRLLPSRLILGLHLPCDDLDTGRPLTFVVGGNRLVRGLSIENLLVTYPLEHRRMSRGDALLQHAIMFGYRMDSQPFSRFFLTREQARRFRAVYENESALIGAVKLRRNSTP